MDAAEQDPITAWMETNTFECPHGQGRLSPESCAELRNRPDIAQASGAPTPSQPGKDYRPGVCRTCTQYRDLWDEVAKRRAEAEQEESKTEDTQMSTWIDCLACGAQDVPNQGRGLCKRCYLSISAKQRQHYDLEEAKQRRRMRLEGYVPGSDDGLLVGPEPEDDLEPRGKQREPSDPDKYGKEAEDPEEACIPEEPPFSAGEDDPLAGYDLVPAQTEDWRAREVKIGPQGKHLSIGAYIVRDHGLRQGDFVHIYAGRHGLALRILDRQDPVAFKLCREGKNKRCQNSKLVVSISKLVRQGVVHPGQKFRVRPHESGKIIYLDSIEESASEKGDV